MVYCVCIFLNDPRTAPHLDGFSDIEHIQHQAKCQEGQLYPEGCLQLSFKVIARLFHLDNIGVIDNELGQLDTDLRPNTLLGIYVQHYVDERFSYLLPLCCHEITLLGRFFENWQDLDTLQVLIKLAEGPSDRFSNGGNDLLDLERVNHREMAVHRDANSEVSMTTSLSESVSHLPQSVGGC